MNKQLIEKVLKDTVKSKDFLSSKEMKDIGKELLFFDVWGKDNANRL